MREPFIRGSLLFVLIASCTDDTPVTTLDVITVFSVAPASGPTAFADGVSRATATVGTVTDSGRGSNLSATLALSDGAWVFPVGNDSKVTTINLLDSVGSADFVLPQTAGTIEVMATIDGFSETQTLPVSPAPVVRVDVSATGILPGAGSGATATEINLSAVVETGGNGSLPSVDTPVEFLVTTAPASDGFPLQDREFITGSNTLTETFTAIPPATTLTFQAIANPDSAMPIASTVVTLGGGSDGSSSGSN